jgi:hypothetical protein
MGTLKPSTRLTLYAATSPPLAPAPCAALPRHRCRLASSAAAALASLLPSPSLFTEKRERERARDWKRDRRETVMVRK